MSRIAKKPLQIPDGVDVSLQGNDVFVKGKRGNLSIGLPAGVNLDISAAEAKVDFKSGASAFAGLFVRFLYSAMVGVSKGYTTVLNFKGLGYRASVDGNKVILQVGYSHPVSFSIPDGISVVCEKDVVLSISGISKQLVGQVAANIRAVRPPNPYKGHGISYAGEKLMLKVGKKK